MTYADTTLRSVCADILRNIRPTETYQYYRRCQGANLLDYVDAREAVELADECADERDGLQADLDALQDRYSELEDERGQLIGKLQDEIAALKSELAEQKL